MSNTIQLFQVLAWCQTGNRPLLEPIMNDDPSIDVAGIYASLGLHEEARQQRPIWPK